MVYKSINTTFYLCGLQYRYVSCFHAFGAVVIKYSKPILLLLITTLPASPFTSQFIIIQTYFCYYDWFWYKILQKKKINIEFIFIFNNCYKIEHIIEIH